MWNPIKLIIQSPKAMGDVVSGGMAALDNAFFTDQEKEAGRKAMLSTITEYMAKTTGQDVARRSLALLASVTFITLCFIVVAFLCFEEPNKNGVLYRSDLLKDFIVSSNIAWGWMLAMTFYFAPHMIAKFVGAGKQ